MEIDMKDVNYDLRFLMTLDVFDHNIWVEPNGENAIFINYIQDSQDSEAPFITPPGPIVQVFGVFKSENLLGFCIIPDNFNESSQNSIVNFNVVRNISNSSNKIQELKIINNSKKSLEAFLGDGSDEYSIEVYGPVLVSVESQPWEDVVEILTDLNTFKVQTDPESMDSDYLQVTPKHGVYYLVGNSTDDFFDQEIAFILHEEILQSFFQSINLPVNYLD